MYKYISILLLGILLVSCQKESPISEDQTQRETLTIKALEQRMQSGVNEERNKVASILIKALESPEFQSALYEGISEMRDGDNEVLFAEMVAPKTRGQKSWASVVSSHLSTLINETSVKTRSNANKINEFIARILKNDPLLQVALIGDENYNTTESMMSDPRLHVAILPKEFDDHKDYNILAYDRNGNKHVLDSRKRPDFPVVIISENERISVVKADKASPEQTQTAYFTHGDHVYIKRDYDKWHRKEDPGIHDIDDEWMMPIVHPVGPINQVIPNTQAKKRKDYPNKKEVLLKAGFTSQDALKTVEPWPLGRPEMKFVAAINDSEKVSQYCGDKGWWNAQIKPLDIDLFCWSSHAIPGDFYSVEWIEVDSGSGVKEISLSAQYMGIKGTISFKIANDDDQIGNALVYYEDDVPDGGRKYKIGTLFNFWISLSK